MSVYLRNRLRKILTGMIWIILAAVAALYIIICVAMYAFQSRMIYFPSRTVSITPREANLEYEDVNLIAEDGVRVHGWFIPTEGARATLLFCHGNGGNISHRMESIMQFRELGLSVFIFDYHGYGLSEGKPGEQQTYMDAEAAWNYLTEEKGLPADSIIIFGRSLGGAVAVWLAREHRAGALIVESSFTSVPEVAWHYYPFLPVKLLARFQYNSLERIRHIDVPTLFIHSPDDDIIPYKFGRRLYEAAGNPKQFLEIGGTHNDGFLTCEAAYLKGLDEFLAHCLDGEQ